MADMTVKTVSILGATGSVGRAAADLVIGAPERFQAEAIAAGSDAEALANLGRELKARFVAVADENRYRDLKNALSGYKCEIAAGAAAVKEAGQRQADIAVAAIVGLAGLESTLAACMTGKTVALANKEALVSAGDVVKAAAAANGAQILPVDSEHSALFQAYEPERAHTVEKLTLTASGGPFWKWSKSQIANATLEDALRHPTWDMGSKITIDSATMMNKGLELIEAARLFPLPEDRIDVLIHPQSIIHGMVSYRDGSVMAQLGAPDMQTPIAVALAWPDRMQTPVQRLDLASIGQLTFDAPDPERFPSINLARQALRDGGDRPAVLNASNEVAVAAFLEGRISFMAIVETVMESLAVVPRMHANTLEQVVEVDRQARLAALNHISSLT
jgi:1-deoxy-D-xylulose-5-phosphate reductoisomerase